MCPIALPPICSGLESQVLSVDWHTVGGFEDHEDENGSRGLRRSSFESTQHQDGAEDYLSGEEARAAGEEAG